MSNIFAQATKVLWFSAVNSIARLRLSAHLRSFWWPALAALAGLWLLARPFTGVRHDGILYLGQLYLQSRPQVFQNDFFFAYGSQDDFTIFSKFGALLLSDLGLENFQRLMLFSCHALLLLAAMFLIRPLRSSTLKLSGLISLTVMPHFYGGMGIFSFAESFITARTLAEPLALAGLAALSLGHGGIAVVMLIGSAAVHPLMALPAICVAWVLVTFYDRRWLWLAPSIAVLVSVAALSDKAPFDMLLQSYDSAWLRVTQTSNPFVFPHLWNFEDAVKIVVQLALLVLAWRLLPAKLGLLAAATAIAAAGLTLLAFLGASLFSNVLLTQLQMWRGLWLSQLLSLLILPALCYAIWVRGKEWRTCSLALGCVGIAAMADWPSTWALLLWLVLMWWVARSPATYLSAFMRRLLLPMSVAVLMALSVAMVITNLLALQGKGVRLGPAVLLWTGAVTPALVFTLAALVGNATRRTPYPTLTAWLLALSLLATGLLNWDRRTEWQRVFETTPAKPHPFTLETQPASQVYWRESLLTTWAMLGRPNFFSDQQGSGVLFNRATAMEYDRRSKALAPLSFQRELCSMLASIDRNEAWAEDCVPDEELIVELCALPKGPDYLVFPFRLSRGVVSEWRFSPRDSRSSTYYLHECAGFR